jgi:UDP-glucuronate 4-epimerase
MRILVTGAAGFIGMHVCQLLLSRGDEVLGIDNLNDYYDPALKNSRLSVLRNYSNFEFQRLDISDSLSLNTSFRKYTPEAVINLAAQAGVRYSITRPEVYINSNLVGFANILEACRHHDIKHLLYASSSSVYGSNTKVPFAVGDRTENPVSLYAATKKSNELMAHAYSHLFGIATTGIRYFTVYGPWGRPDMAPWLFTEAILKNKEIDVFNDGKMRRDFTYVSDAAEATVALLDAPPITPSGTDSRTLFNIVNVGSDKPIELLRFIELLENSLGIDAKKRLLPMQQGDVVATWADLDGLRDLIPYQPKVSIEAGIAKFVAWYQSHKGLNISN